MSQDTNLKEPAKKREWFRKIQQWKMPFTTAVGVLFLAGLAGFFVGRVSTPRALPAQSFGGETAQTASTLSSNVAVTVTTTTSTIYEQVALPSDAETLLTDTLDKGTRTRIIRGFITNKGAHSIEPAQDPDKPSQRTIVTTSSSSIDTVRVFVADLEGKSWQLASRALTGDRINYIYKKADQYIWLNGDHFIAQDWDDVYHYLMRHDVTLVNTINATGKVKSEVIEIVEGFKLPDKDVIVQNLDDADM